MIAINKTMTALLPLSALIVVCGCTPYSERVHNLSAHIAGDIGAAAKADGSKQWLVGVVPFAGQDNDEKQSKDQKQLGEAVTQYITDELIKGRQVTVVADLYSDEAKRIRDEIRKQDEQGGEQGTKELDPATIQKAGNMLGVNALLIVHITDAVNAFTVSCRLYDVATCRVIAGGAANGDIEKPGESPLQFVIGSGPAPVYPLPVYQTPVYHPYYEYYEVAGRFYWWDPRGRVYLHLTAVPASARIVRCQKLPAHS